ncbi:MAG: hypothetical protein R2910_02490 [Gemmatimonadales bacterium]
MNPNIKDHASAGGHAKATTVAAQELARLRAADLGDLRLHDTADAQRLLARATDLTMRGDMTPSRASAIAKTVAEWARIENLRLDQERIKVAERRIGELEAELKQARTARAVA